MIPLSFPDKRAALLGAFLNRFAIGFVIGAARLPVPSWAQGLIFGILLSLPDAIITQAFCADPRSWRCRRNYHRDYCRQVGRLVAITKVSDVSDLLTQARQNPHKSFPAILKLATSEDKSAN